MQYWVCLKKGDGYIHYYDYFLPGLIPDHVLELMIANTVDEKMGLCKNCPFDTRCHVIEEGTGRKYCETELENRATFMTDIEDALDWYQRINRGECLNLYDSRLGTARENIKTIIEHYRNSDPVNEQQRTLTICPNCGFELQISKELKG